MERQNNLNMDGSLLTYDQAIEKLIEMGFGRSIINEAVKEVGPSLDSAVEFILNGCRNSDLASSSFKCSTNNVKTLGKRKVGSSHYLGKTRQTSIVEHFQSTVRPKRTESNKMFGTSIPRSEAFPGPAEELRMPPSDAGYDERNESSSSLLPSNCCDEVEVGVDWEKKVNKLLCNHFGYSSIKSFQKEALAAWLAHQDCLVLAATGSGKSLCFQIPALLTGKVVVVISPLISLMHDQCLKLSRHGIPACFLGSGQPDSSVEKKAMNGMYSIIYVCPETVLRLIKPLQRLAENRGITLFAIDEVHCVSKWGHDFRPDYRRLSVLRENFSARNSNFLKFDVPLMALTATATICVREDILSSLCMSKETQIVVTSFFRPNLRFSVKHSRTSSPSSYEKDFQELISTYSKKLATSQKNHGKISLEEHLFDDFSDYANGNKFEGEGTSSSDIDKEDNILINNSLIKQNGSTNSKEKHMSVEYLEDEADDVLNVDDWDVAFGEFPGQYLADDGDSCRSPKKTDPPFQPEEKLKFLRAPLEHGPTIIYVPTRKETLSIAKFLSRFGVKAAAYNAKLPKSHLRQVHKGFHENSVEVVVATIAFGMGIDKLNVRRIIHYGWPQSLEAYYQEAGRAGRDGKVADCVLYANLSRIPTLLPSQRSVDQTKQAYKMLSECYRYGMNTSCCRAKVLVEYFGEEFGFEKCLLCDVCVDGPPEMQNLKEEADAFLQVIAAFYGQSSSSNGIHEGITYSDTRQRRSMDKPNIRMIVSSIREQFNRFTASDQLFWRGLARILEDKRYIRERDGMKYVHIKFPEPTELGMEFLQSKVDLYLYPEADMLLSMRSKRPYSSFSEWGKGWADPEIRRQRLERKQSGRKPRNRKPRKHRQSDPSTARGRLTAKLTKLKKYK